MAGRASNGESTIYKGADGRWHGYVSVGFKLDGKLDRRHVSSKSRGVVVAKVRELERQRDTGTVSETSTPVVAWWLEHWLTTIAPRRVRQRTLESYESAVRKHLIPGIGWHRLDRLRPEHLDQLYTALLDGGYSPASMLRHHRILSRALTVAVQRGHVPRNVAALVDPPAQRQSDLATALDLDEARAVLEAAATLLLRENVHPRVVMELLGHSQMRTTMDIYSHVMPALAREAADRMGALLLASKGRQTATRDDSGRPPEGERPGHTGGAEGTRTPDPHTARPS